jgi:hypothetical protein
MRNFTAHSVEVQRFAAPWRCKSQHLKRQPESGRIAGRHTGGCQLVNFGEITAP